MSADGGKIRIRPPLAEECRWLDYKGVRLHEFATGACFETNQPLIDWVRQHPLSCPVTGLGDGHDGGWNLIQPIAPETQRREILDWYHLMEKRQKVGGSKRRLNQARAGLCKGDVAATIALVEGYKRNPVANFCAYVRKHRHRIVN